MAIVVEEERKGVSSGVVSLIVWLVILGIIASAVYYVFFAEPELIQIAAPETLIEAERVSQAEIDPQAILDDPRFGDLQQYVTLPPPGTFGRANPFLGLTFTAPAAPAAPRR